MIVRRINFLLPAGIIVLVLSFFAACTGTKHLKSDELLLKKNTIVIVKDSVANEAIGFETYEPEDLIKPKPNTKLLRLPVYLYLYNLADPERVKEKKQRKDEKCNKKIEDRIEKIDLKSRLQQRERDKYNKNSRQYAKYDKKLKRLQAKKNTIDKSKCDWQSFWHKIGEAPVLYRKIDVGKSERQIEIFLRNRGYYNADISSETVRKSDKKKEVQVKYKINLNKPHLINSLKYQIPDSALAEIIVSDSSATVLKQGKRLDTDILQEERSRIELMLRNKGYYKFSGEYIAYIIDTLSTPFRADLVLTVRKMIDENGQKSNHRKYRFNKIFIYPDFDPKKALTDKETYYNSFDTIPYFDNDSNTFYFIRNQRKTLKPQALARGVYLYRDTLFNLYDIQDSYRYLSSLKIIKIANINLEENPVVDSKDSSGRLDCIIKLTPDKRQAFTYEITGTNTSGNIGAAGNIRYEHRNIFGSGEVLEISVKAALERQDRISTRLKSFFNSREYGAELTLRFPRLVAPVNLTDFKKRFSPKTEINLVYNKMDRPDYTRTIAGTSVNYVWNSTTTIKHSLQPVFLDMIKLENADTSFLEYIEKYRLTGSYENHMILGTSYNFIINNQLKKHKREYTYLKLGVKTAGNFLSLISRSTGEENSEGTETVLYNQYAQFVKGEYDFRFYKSTGRKNDKVVLRTYAALAYPYGNSTTVPFGEKYFSGGANSIRAWQVRTLGPGSYITPDTLDIFPNQTGDIKLEANFEYRLKLFWMVEGAFFIDAGNIWAINTADKREGALFKIDKFYNEIAVGTGYGFRMDFDFFIIRFDFGLRLREPFAENGKHWIPGNRKWTYNDWAFSVGIGYPF